MVSTRAVVGMKKENPLPVWFEDGNVRKQEQKGRKSFKDLISERHICVPGATSLCRARLISWGKP